MTPWTIAYQAPPSMGFSRQEYWSGLPCLPSGDLHDPGIEPVSFMSPALQVGSLPLVPPGKPQNTHKWWHLLLKSLSRVRLFTTPWTIAYQAPPSMGFSRKEDWSGVPLPSPKLSTDDPKESSDLTPHPQHTHTYITHTPFSYFTIGNAIWKHLYYHLLYDSKRNHMWLHFVRKFSFSWSSW